MPLPIQSPMGLFIPSNYKEEIDPRWQKRRQILLAVIGVISLLVAAGIVHHFWENRPRGSERPTGPVIEVDGGPILVVPD